MYHQGDKGAGRPSRKRPFMLLGVVVTLLEAAEPCQRLPDEAATCCRTSGSTLGRGGLQEGPGVQGRGVLVPLWRCNQHGKGAWGGAQAVGDRPEHRHIGKRTCSRYGAGKSGFSSVTLA